MRRMQWQCVRSVSSPSRSIDLLTEPSADRGEAANHGLLDAYHLVDAICQIYNGQVQSKEALDIYESEMRMRTKQAVRLSRQACLDAHAWNQLNENSAILTKRSIVGSRI